MTRRLDRIVVLLGPLLVLATQLPWPSPLRASLALLSLLVSWPLALWPLWRPLRHPHAGAIGDAGGREACLQLAGWAPLGILPLLLLVVPGYLGVSLSHLLVCWLAGLAVAAWIGWRQPRDLRAAPRATPRGVAGLLAVVGLGLLPLWVSGQGAPLSPFDDACDHLATVRHLLTADRLEFPGAFYGRDIPDGWDPRKGVLHVALALAARLAHVDALEAWQGAPVVLALLTGLIYLAFARAVLGRGLAAAMALALLLVLAPDPGRFVRGAYGGHWGLVMAWSGVALALSGGGLLWGLLCGAACAGVHAYAPAQLLAPLLILAGWPGKRGTGEGGSPRSFVIGGLAGAIPVELFRLLVSASGGNPLHSQFMPVLQLSLGTVASPLEVLRAWSFPGCVAGLALLALGWLRRERTFGYLAGAFLVPLPFLCAPGLFGWVGEHFGSVANKLLMVWEPGVAIVAVLSWPWRTTQAVGAPPLRLPGRFLAGVAILATTVSLLPGIPGRMDALLQTRPATLTPSLRAAISLVDGWAPVDAVIATDPVTAYALPAFTGRRSIVTLHQHAPPGDLRALERIAATSALFAPCIELSEALALARREGATHLLFVPGPARRVDQYANHTDPRNEATLVDRFRSHPELTLLASENEARLMTIGPGRKAEEGGTPQVRPPSIRPDPLVSPVEIRLASVVLSMEALLTGPVWNRGEMARVSAQWRRVAPPASGYEEILAHIRFENIASPRSQGPWKSFSKPLRRLYLERKAGGSFRWRAVELPFRGLCPPVAWPIGESFADTLEFAVPPNLLPGRYRLRVALETGTLYPVMNPADLLKDEDRFSGPILGYVEIQ